MSTNIIDLSIVIVNWNSWNYLKRCLDSIFEHSKDIQLEIIVIDNCSTDKSVDKIKEYFPEVFLIPLNKNLGFPKANNIGFKLAKGKYILALNPDTEIKYNALKSAINFLDENQNYGCVGVKTRKPNGEIQFSCARQFHSIRGIIATILFIDKIFPSFKCLNAPDMTYWDHEQSRDIDVIQGSFMLFRRSVYEKIGGFDERLFMFLEDVEYCIRLWKYGYKIRYLGDVEIIHHGAKSTNKASSRWISELRFEGFYLLIQDLYGTKKALIFLVSLLFLLPIRLVALPLMNFGLYYKKRENRLRLYFYETLFGFEWTVKKLIKEFI